VKSKRDRVFRSYNRTRWNKDKGEKDERCFGLADTEVYQGYTEVFRIGKLLSLIH